MFSGATVSDREGNNYFGGGVTVEGGIFHMHGGTIRNCGIKCGSICWGGGVAVMFGGSFIMDGSEITGCCADSRDRYTSYGGGVFVGYGSSFTVNGGTISDNRADVGGGVMFSGNSAVMNIDGGLHHRQHGYDMWRRTCCGGERRSGGREQYEALQQRR